MSSLEIVSYEIKPDVVQLVLSGSVVAGETVAKLEQSLRDHLRRYGFILLDMTRVNRLDARGVGCLVEAHVLASAAGKQIRLWNLPPRIREILLIVRLITIFGPAVQDLPKAA